MSDRNRATWISLSAVSHITAETSPGCWRVMTQRPISRQPLLTVIIRLSSSAYLSNPSHATRVICDKSHRQLCKTILQQVCANACMPICVWLFAFVSEEKRSDTQKDCMCAHARRQTKHGRICDGSSLFVFLCVYMTHGGFNRVMMAYCQTLSPQGAAHTPAYALKKTIALKESLLPLLGGLHLSGNSLRHKTSICIKASYVLSQQ